MDCLRRFILHCGGVSATEFALAAPMLLVVLSGIATGWVYASQTMEMRSAVKTGANYVLQGGTDLAVVKSSVLLAWPNMPDDGDVQVVRECRCGDTVHSCTTVCTGSGDIPDMSVIITASGSLDVPIYDLFQSERVLTNRQEEIRVR